MLKIVLNNKNLAKLLGEEMIFKENTTVLPFHKQNIYDIQEFLIYVGGVFEQK